MFLRIAHDVSHQASQLIDSLYLRFIQQIVFSAFKVTGLSASLTVTCNASQTLNGRKTGDCLLADCRHRLSVAHIDAHRAANVAQLAPGLQFPDPGEGQGFEEAKLQILNSGSPL